MNSGTKFNGRKDVRHCPIAAYFLLTGKRRYGPVESVRNPQVERSSPFSLRCDEVHPGRVIPRAQSDQFLFQRRWAMQVPSTHCSLLAMLREEGDCNSAWNAFHARYRDLILTWCRQRGLDAEAEDLTQEVFLKLIRALPQHVHDPRRGQFRGWLKTVVNNTRRDLWRTRQRHVQPPGIGGSTFLGKLGNLADIQGHVEELSTFVQDQAKRDAVEIVSRARARVNEKTWQAFIRTHYEKAPATEVARDLGLKAGTIYKHIDRVKAILREERQRVLNRQASDAI
jgi:RNA polymerase sigma factor (sigma-70 family)